MENKQQGKLASWAQNLIIAICAVLAWALVRATDLPNYLGGFALIIGAIFLVWGVIGYLLTKRD